MIALEQHARGVILPVRARAGARKNAITGKHDGMLKVSVTQAPEKGKANKAITALLAGALELRPAQLELLGGATSGKKRFLVTGVSIVEMAKRLDGVLNDLG